MATEKQIHLVDWLSKYWFLIVAILAGAVAWGQTLSQVQGLADDISSLSEFRTDAEKNLSDKDKEIANLRAAIDRLDERTKDTKDAQQAILERLLKNKSK